MMTSECQLGHNFRIVSIPPAQQKEFRMLSGLAVDFCLSTESGSVVGKAQAEPITLVYITEYLIFGRCLYRMTIQVVPNLLLTSKQKLRLLHGPHTKTEFLS